jgi:hypothetical protein
MTQELVSFPSAVRVPCLGHTAQQVGVVLCCTVGYRDPYHFELGPRLWRLNQGPWWRCTHDGTREISSHLSASYLKYYKCLLQSHAD